MEDLMIAQLFVILQCAAVISGLPPEPTVRAQSANVIGRESMKSIQDLLTEHEGIKRMLRVLEAVARRSEAGETLDAGDVGEILEFLTVFADRCHHGKEEEYLFPALEAAGMPRQGGLIGMLLDEHAQGRALIKRMKEAAGDLRAGKDGASKLIGVAADEYAVLLSHHIQKENSRLFPDAEKALGPEKDAGLMAAFEKIEEERIGPGRHEEFHALLDRLERAYPAR